MYKDKPIYIRYQKIHHSLKLSRAGRQKETRKIMCIFVFKCDDCIQFFIVILEKHPPALVPITEQDQEY